jgi:hypothetical protein
MLIDVFYFWIVLVYLIVRRKFLVGGFGLKINFEEKF